MCRRLLPAALALLACCPLARAQAEAEGPRKYTTVIAEGAGLSVEEARQDAFRNAVRQAVGALIDAETLVKQDQVIKDQILAHSNAMIKSYKEVGKVKSEKGLYRVTIVAAVENLGLEERVAKARDAFLKVDGEGLYAKLLQDLEGEKAYLLIESERRRAARALLEKSLEGFPLNCLGARLEGEPKVVNREGDKATFQARVRLEPDVKAFDAFAARLTRRLEEMARSRGDFALQAELRKDEKGDYFEFPVHWREHMGRQFEGDAPWTYRNRGTCVLAVNTRRLTAERPLWRYYELDDSVRHPLASAASCVFTVKLSWLDKGGEVLDTARFPAVLPAGGSFLNANLVAACVVPGRGAGKALGGFRGFDREGYDAMVADEGGADKGGERLFLMSPSFVDPGWYAPQGVITHEYTMSLAALKQVARIKCELIFEDDKYREVPPKVVPDK